MGQGRWSLFMAVLFTASSFLCGCNSATSSATFTVKKIVMKVGHSQPITHPRHQSLLKFKETVEHASHKQIEVQIYAGGQLGNEAEQMDMVKTGALQATRGGQFEAAAPQLLIYTMPFLFENIESAHQITRGPIGEKLARFAERNNIAILATGDAGGLRHITNNRRPVTSPQDMRGLKIRTPPVESIIKSITAFGANPVSFPYDEVYMALKLGVADGQENPLVNIAALKLDEVQQYLTIINYQYHPDPFYVNLGWYNSLAPDAQRIIKDASIEMMRYNDELVAKETKRSFAQLEKSMTINVLTDAAKAEFVRESASVYEYYINKKLFTKQDLAEIQSAVASAPLLM